MSIQFGLLLLAAYLVGALPVAFLAARWVRGIDLRRYGTGQVGAGNLWRSTSRRVGVPIVVFDIGKGALMVWVGRSAGLPLSQGIALGLACMAGHNWSVFLRFSGGRGMATAVGLMALVPLIYGLVPWPIIAFLAVALTLWALERNGTSLPALAGFAAAPVVSWGFGQPPALSLGLLGILFLTVAKRLALGQPGVEGVSKGELLVNRVLYDRDLRDRKAWLYRRPGQEPANDDSGK